MNAQGSQTNAKEDTVFLALDGDLVTDLSQYETDLTVATGGGFELNSERAALTGSTGREVYVRCTLSAAEASIVLAAHSTTIEFAYTWAIRTNASGNLECVQGNTFFGLTVVWQGPVVPAADLSVAWSTRPNPDTTGSSDALISEIVVYDHDAEAYLAIDQVVHAAPTTASEFVLAVGGVHSSGSLTSRPAKAPTAFRLSRSFHTNVEFAEDWVAPRTAYAGSLDDGPTEPVPVLLASTIGDSGQFVGRAQVGYAAAHARQAQRRSWSSLVNDTFVDVDTMTSTPAPANWALPDFGDGLYTLMLPWLRWVSVPSGCTHAWVRVHVKTWVTAGDPVPIGVRCYAMNRPPAVDQIGQIPAPEFDAHYRGATLTIDHTSTGKGQWIDIGLVKLPTFTADVPGWIDTVHLCLAYAIDPAGGSANDANARLQINAWHARPVRKWTPGGLE